VIAQYNEKSGRSNKKPPAEPGAIECSGKQAKRSMRELALRELRSTAGAAKTWLLALLHTSIAGQEALFAELFRKIAIVLHQCPGDALHAGPSLARAATAVDEDHHVHIVTHAGMLQRGKYRVAVLLHLEKVFERSLIDSELAAAGANSHAGNRGLAAAGSKGINDFFCGGHEELSVEGVLS
jgi:hypothetical protein